ncbi:MAG: hypothetical protein CVU57_25125 [Deltaproteobacteria bacterium HGW-Deltaproteobacteria-15]|jgi:hypothetical protein|nr:MAG: hypothetical protein CVU57_25125 [Deltaproteobacteria bacterium HGW-Deltaproteobacteria-15]
MSELRTDPLVWVKDGVGNRFLCPMDALRDPNSVSEEEKADCVDDASSLLNPKSVPGEGKLRFSESSSPN